MKNVNYESDDKYNKRIQYCLDAKRHNYNADITIPDYKYQKKQKRRDLRT